MNVGQSVNRTARNAITGALLALVAASGISLIAVPAQAASGNPWRSADGPTVSAALRKASIACAQAGYPGPAIYRRYHRNADGSAHVEVECQK